MVYGLSDDLREESKARQKAVELLLAVAEGKKTVTDVQAWLEKNYPKLCAETENRKKW